MFSLWFRWDQVNVDTPSNTMLLAECVRSESRKHDMCLSSEKGELGVSLRKAAERLLLKRKEKPNGGRSRF